MYLTIQTLTIGILGSVRTWLSTNIRFFSYWDFTDSEGNIKLSPQRTYRFTTAPAVLCALFCQHCNFWADVNLERLRKTGVKMVIFHKPLLKLFYRGTWCLPHSHYSVAKELTIHLQCYCILVATQGAAPNQLSVVNKHCSHNNDHYID